MWVLIFLQIFCLSLGVFIALTSAAPAAAFIGMGIGSFCGLLPALYLLFFVDITRFRAMQARNSANSPRWLGPLIAGGAVASTFLPRDSFPIPLVAGVMSGGVTLIFSILFVVRLKFERSNG
jgi:hypothetical protein